MAQIIVDLDELRQEANLINKCNENTEETIQRLVAGLSKLGDTWKDTGYETFKDENDKKINSYNTLNESLMKDFTFLKRKIETANEYLQVYGFGVNATFGSTTTQRSSVGGTNAVTPDKKTADQSNSMPEELKEEIIQGSKQYNPFGKYEGMLKVIKVKDEKGKIVTKELCHDKEGKLTFMLGGNRVFTGKFENDIPMKGEIVWSKHAQFDKYIGGIKIGGSSFVADGLGDLFYIKDKIKLEDIIVDENIRKNHVIYESLNLYAVKYQGGLDSKFSPHGTGCIFIPVVPVDKESIIKYRYFVGKFENGKMIELLGDEAKNEVESLLEWTREDGTLVKCSLDKHTSGTIKGTLFMGDNIAYKGELKEVQVD